MPNNLPERISLLQAALWLLKSRKPTAESIFQIAKVRLAPAEISADGPLGALVIALSQGELQGYARAGRRKGGQAAIEQLVQQPLPQEIVGSAEKAKGKPLFPEIIVASRNWNFDRIVWNESALLTERGAFGGAPSIFQALRLRDDPANWPREAALYYFPIMLDTLAVAQRFPYVETHAELVSVETRGRKKKWDWDKLYVELVVTADLDALPESQSACEKWALDWFSRQSKDGSTPVVSQIREKISPIYSHVRRMKRKAEK